MIRIETLNTAYLLSTDRAPESEGNRAETWRVDLLLNDGSDTKAFLKIQPAYETLADLIGALVGRAVGMRIPKPCLVLAKRAKFTDGDGCKSKQWAALFKDQEETLLFALEDAKAISFKRRINANSTQAAKDLRRWDRYADTAIYDEWIANTDRNFGNILFDGVDYWLIDHDLSLMGEYRQLWGLEASRPCPDNLLLEALLRTNPSEIQRYRLRKDANQLSGRYRQLDLSGLVQPRLIEYARLMEEISHRDIHEAMTFLADRITYLTEIVCHKLGMPELPLGQPG